MKNAAYSGLGNDELEAIGCVAVESSAIEFLIECAIWELCGLDENTGPLFTAKWMLGAKADLLKNIVALRLDEESQCAFQKMYDNLMTAIQDRNVAIHSIWLAVPSRLKPGGATSFAVSTKRSRKKRKYILAEDVMKIANQLAEIHCELREYLEQLPSPQ